MHRLALGCLRAGPDAIAAALDAGVRAFDTARAYGESERVLGELVAGRDVRVVTKGGMKREGSTWRPDGRARALREDVEASLRALGRSSVDTYLVHAPDPRVPWRTTVRELARIADEKLARRVGVCNVTRRQLDEAMEIAPVEVVQTALGVASDDAIRGGVVARCIERGVEVMARGPFGGPRRAAGLARDRAVVELAARHGVSPFAIVLAMLLDLHPAMTVVFGTSSPAHLREALAAVALGAPDREALDARFGLRRALSPPRVAADRKSVV